MHLTPTSVSECQINHVQPYDAPPGQVRGSGRFGASPNSQITLRMQLPACRKLTLCHVGRSHVLPEPSKLHEIGTQDAVRLLLGL